jgi:hypothetical protein
MKAHNCRSHPDFYPAVRQTKKRHFPKISVTKLNQRERERRKLGGSERPYIWGGGRNYISGLEGSQAVPACPSGIGNTYDRN